MQNETQKTTLIPFHDNLLLEMIAAAEKSGGGIIVPEAHRSKLNQGRVVDKGPLCTAAVQIGDEVFFQLHSQSEIALGNGQKFLVVTESACLGAIRRENNTKD